VQDPVVGAADGQGGGQAFGSHGGGQDWLGGTGRIVLYEGLDCVEYEGVDCVEDEGGGCVA
jgi:hypothetical protein